MTTEMKIIHDQISALTKSITTLEQELKKQDLRFLKSYKSIKMSCRAQLQCTPQNPKIITGELIHVAKKVLGNLKFRLWEKMLVIDNHNASGPGFIQICPSKVSLKVMSLC
ncbi:E3 ubiquitin-protein ligase TRIM35-like isoform 2-T4 [Salvelinus alpinus]